MSAIQSAAGSVARPQRRNPLRPHVAVTVERDPRSPEPRERVGETFVSTLQNTCLEVRRKGAPAAVGATFAGDGVQLNGTLPAQLKVTALA